MVHFLYGVVAMGWAVAALFFLRFWRDSAERLFLRFSIAFWVFAVNYAMLGLLPSANERRASIFTLRLLGFLIIIWAIARKNSATDPPP
jgi:hypothetical protein